MQTDPNWGNFLYDANTGVLNLIDFGAAKEYPHAFVDNYLRMVHACAERDRGTVIDMSRRLGFLTGGLPVLNGSVLRLSSQVHYQHIGVFRELLILLFAWALQGFHFLMLCSPCYVFRSCAKRCCCELGLKPSWEFLLTACIKQQVLIRDRFSALMLCKVADIKKRLLRL
jgi:hypothetical protein